MLLVGVVKCAQAGEHYEAAFLDLSFAVRYQERLVR